MTIAVAIWDGVEELDVVGPYEVLTAWGAQANGRSIHVHTVAERADEVRCAHGLRLLPDRTWDDVGEIDVLVLPGGNARPQAEDERVLGRVRELGENGTLMTSVCTGALILAAAGLLEGRPATTHWSALESLAAYDGVEVRPDARFVDDGHGGHRGRRLRRDRHGPPPGRAAGLAGAGEGRAALHPVRPRASRMRRAAAIAALLALAASCASASSGGLPGARSIKVCAAAGPFWPTMTLALQGTTAWVACKTQSRIVRVNTKTGKTTKSIRLRGPAIAVVVRARLDLGARLRRDALPASTRDGEDRQADRAERRGRVQHLDRRRLRLGRGRPGSERRPRLSRFEPRRRADRGRRRAGQHGLRRRQPPGW